MTHDTDNIFSQGAVIVPDFITPAEEERILLRIDQAPWLTELRRRVQHYGWRYDYRGGVSHAPAPSFPRWSSVMAERLRPHFASVIPVQCIVNEYRPGQGIGMHSDHRSFGPIVASLSLGAAWSMRFRRRNAGPYVRTGQPKDEIAVLPRRSALILAGAARSDWMHGIDPTDVPAGAHTRVSATFRTLAA